MRSSQFLRKIAELEEEVKRLYDGVKFPVYDFMSEDEMLTLRDLLREGIARNSGGSMKDNPEAMAIWKVACARMEKCFDGKQTWPHWRALWFGGVEETQRRPAAGPSRGKPARK